MRRKLVRSAIADGGDDAGWNIDLDQLLHPADAFDHPADVANDEDLTLAEKRAILASWASDAAAIGSDPLLRSNGKRAVPFDEVMDALRSLDRIAQALKEPRDERPAPCRHRWRRDPRDGGEGQSASPH